MTSKIEQKIENLEMDMLDVVEDPKTTSEEKTILQNSLTNLQKTRILLKKSRKRSRPVSSGIFVHVGDGSKQTFTVDELKNIFWDMGTIDEINIGKTGFTAIISFTSEQSIKKCLDKYPYYWKKYGIYVEKQLKYKK